MGEEKVKTNEAKKKDDSGSTTVVLKVDLHCDGCWTKISRQIKRFEGVEKVTGDITTNKVTVMGKLDPMKLKEKLESKIKKKVELISPKLKSNKEASGDGEKKPEDKPAEKKNKETPVTTVVLKTRLHCQGCIGKMEKAIAKFKGAQEYSLDRQKETVTVKGTMDVKGLQSYLQEKLKTGFDVVPPAKGDGGGDKKVKGSDGGGAGKKDKGGDGEKEKVVGGGGGGGGGGGENQMPMYQMPMYQMPMYQTPVYMPMYQGHPPGYYPVGYGHAPQIFSEENPNACSFM